MEKFKPSTPSEHHVFDQNQNLSGNSICFMIRHTERADKTVIPETFRTKEDPPLSSLGIKQSHITGQYLKKWFEMNEMEFDKIIIESSPFIRTLQTANSIASELGVKQI